MSKAARLDAHNPRTRIVLRVKGEEPKPNSAIPRTISCLREVVGEMRAINPRVHSVKAEVLARWAQSLERASELLGAGGPGQPGT